VGKKCHTKSRERPNREGKVSGKLKRSEKSRYLGGRGNRGERVSVKVNDHGSRLGQEKKQNAKEKPSTETATERKKQTRRKVNIMKNVLVVRKAGAAPENQEYIV